MYKSNSIISNLIRRKSEYQKHLLIGTITSGLLVLLLVLAIMPDDPMRTLDLTGANRYPYRVSPQVNSYGSHPENSRSISKADLNARKTRMVENIFGDALFPGATGRNNQGLTAIDNFPGADGTDCSLDMILFQSAPSWPIDDPPRPLGIIRSSDIILDRLKEPRKPEPDKPIRINFLNDTGIYTPLELRNIVDYAGFKIILTVKENGMIPGNNGIRVLSYRPEDLPKEHYDIFVEDIHNLLRKQAFIYPAEHRGQRIADSTVIDIKYLKGSGKFMAVGNDKVQINW